MIGASGYFLSLYGDVIAEKTGLGGTWVGFAMLATVTSIPELVTGVSAVTYVGVPDIALGDALGSCVFNLLLIVLLDFLHREASVYTRISRTHTLGRFRGRAPRFCGIQHHLVPKQSQPEFWARRLIYADHCAVLYLSCANSFSL